MKLFQNTSLDPDDWNLSEHYRLFGCLSESRKDAKRILEIGTESGSFTSFLGKAFEDASIVSLDLPLDAGMTRLYGREDGQAYKSRQWENVRLLENVSLRELNSVSLTGIETQPFDLIWVDGDHSTPVVTIDLVNSLWVLQSGGLVVVDDVISRAPRRENPMQSLGALSALRALEFAGVISPPIFLRKRLSPKNNAASIVKWIAVAQKTSHTPRLL